MNNPLEIRFDSRTGAVSGVMVNGKNYAAAAPEVFTLQLLDRNGDPRLLKSSEFVNGSHPDFPGLRVETDCRQDGTAAKFRCAVKNVPADLVVEWVDYPQICVPYGNDLFLPVLDGVIVKDPKARKSYHPITFSKRYTSYGFNYPGRAQMQCMAYYDASGNGFYFAALDEKKSTKAVEYEPLENMVRLSMQTFTGCDFGEDCCFDFDYTVQGISRGWQEACTLYRSWFESFTPPPKPYPGWLEDSPVVLIYPVRGHGMDTGEMEPNCYYPYTNILKTVDEYAERLDSRIMALPMHWEGTAPWAPPYVWPPYGGEENLLELGQKLHDKGNLLGLYCSGTAWTCESCITDYAPGCTPEQEKQMVCGPKGELEAMVCNSVEAQRFGYELCMTEEWSRKTMLDEISKMTGAGVDYIQILDQNLGGAMHNCYAQDHDHPPVPGKWQTDAVHSLLKESIGSSSLLLGCEAAAADAFSDVLQLNDARPIFGFKQGISVPAQQFVLHGRSTNFSGNQGGANWVFDNEKSPENLLWRLGYSFDAGDLLAVVLKEDGLPHWSWCLPWSTPAPEAEPVWELIANLNKMRKTYPEFLLYGKKIIPPFEIKVPRHTMYYMGKPADFDSCFVSCWESPSGRRALTAANPFKMPQSVEINGEKLEIPQLSAVCRMI